MESKGKPCGQACIKIDAKPVKKTLFWWMRKIADGYLPELKIKKDIFGLHISINWIKPSHGKAPWDANYNFMLLQKNLNDFQSRLITVNALPSSLLSSNHPLHLSSLERDAALRASELFSRRIDEYASLYWFGVDTSKKGDKQQHE